MSDNAKTINEQALMLLGEIRGRLDEIVRQNGIQSSQLATQSIQIAQVAATQAGQGERLESVSKTLKSLNEGHAEMEKRVRVLEQASVKHSLVSGGVAGLAVAASIEGLRQLLRMKGGGG